METLTRAIVDFGSIAWTSLLAGKDKEHGKTVQNEGGKDVFVNSWMWGYENMVKYLDQVMTELHLAPHQMIFVVEGPNSKTIRQSIHPGYKAGRDKVPAMYDSFNALKDAILPAYRAVGVQIVTQAGVEADDVVGYLAQQLRGNRIVISNDKDLAQLVGPGPKDRLNIHGKVAASYVGTKGLDDSAWDGYIHHYRNGQIDKNPFGPFPHHFIPVAIALVGDASDKIPGALGFGEKAFESMLVAFGEEGLGAMEQLIKKRKLLKLQEDVAELKVLQKVIDSADSVYMSYELGRLHVENVNTMRRPLEWQAGMVKPRDEVSDLRLRKWAGAARIVCAENYEQTLAWARKHLAESPFYSLDIETSTPPESDEWVANLGKSADRTPVDVFGSVLTSIQITFGRNLQFTAYLPVDNIAEPGISNLTVEQARKFVEALDFSKYTYVHNASFELPVLFNTWGQDWINDPLWHGFLPNVLDTRLGANYQDENISAGLKGQSKLRLDYEQTTYDQVTTKEMLKSEWLARPASSMDAKGTMLAGWFEQIPTGEFEPDTPFVSEETGEAGFHPGAEIMRDGPAWVRVQFKMNEMTANEVLAYGADDTICTAALAVHQRIVMEIEDTWHVYLEVEQLPAYLTAKAFIDGVDFSLESMRAMEKDDDITYDKAWAVLREYLIKVGFDGVKPPVYTELSAANIKEAFQLVTGCELKTLVRTVSKLVKLIEIGEWGDADDKAQAFAAVLAAENLDQLNRFVADNFDGEPKLDLASPKQMTRLLYDVMKLPIRIVNAPTAVEWEKKREVAEAVQAFSRKRAGHDVPVEPDMSLVRQKAKADDTAIDSALAFDADLLSDDVKAALKAIGEMKKVMTRKNLFFKTYWNIKHWKDGKIHASINQCGTVTRRYSASNPNVQQLPKMGDGVRFRNHFIPHTKDGVVCSADFSGQELRLAAEISQDKNLLSCYVGDNLRDVHSITASGAMNIKWGRAKVAELKERFAPVEDINSDDGSYNLFSILRAQGKKDEVGKLADDLRKVAKNVNFASIYLAKAPKLADTLIMTLEDATIFLDARNERFSGLNDAAERSEQECMQRGYSLTLMGGRRHLGSKINSDDRGEAARAARQSWNFEIQSSAAEMSKLAMTRIWRSGILWKYDMKFWFPIHDEVVWSVHKDHAAETLKAVNECMTATYSTMTVPIISSLSLGPTFGEQIEVGDYFDAEAIAGALDDVFNAEEQAA